MLALDSHAPGGAGKVAEPIDRDDDCLIERRDVEGRREMGEVMLDLVKLPGKALAGKLVG